MVTVTILWLGENGAYERTVRRQLRPFPVGMPRDEFYHKFEYVVKYQGHYVPVLPNGGNDWWGWLDYGWAR